MKQKICVTTLGCAKNIVDSEKLIATLNNKFQVTENPNNTDYLIINTCGFIQSAIQENSDYIRQAIKLKEIGKIKKIFVVGCLAQRFNENIKQWFPQIDGFYGSDFLSRLPQDLYAEKYELYGERYLLTPRHYAYLKISDGCDHNCAFCSIPSFKGSFQSTPIPELVDEAQKLAQKGVKELILIAQDTTSYGVDIYKKKALNELLVELEKVDGIEWIRLMYAFPRDFPMEILDTIQNSSKIVKYIDIPIQHISTNVLKKMGRGMDKKSTIELLETIRTKVPGIAIRTTVIVGFPNESEQDFAELVEFIKEFKFERLGAFQYSSEPGTPAFVFGDPIPDKIKQERFDTIMKIQQKISLNKNKNLVGKELNVIVDEIQNGISYCRTQFDAPEIDNLVILNNSNSQPGEIVKVKITAHSEYDLFAKRLKIK